MKRVLVTGNAGSGKSKLSRELSELLNIHVYNLDKIIWRSRWQHTALSQCRPKLMRIIEREQWIIDGICLSAIKAADVIIFLDLPRSFCYWQAFKPKFHHFSKLPSGLLPKFPQILIIGYLIKLIWKFPSLVRPALLRALKQVGTEKTVIHIQSYDQLRKLLQTIMQQHQIETSYRYKFL